VSNCATRSLEALTSPAPLSPRASTSQWRALPASAINAVERRCLTLSDARSRTAAIIVHLHEELLHHHLMNAEDSIEHSARGDPLALLLCNELIHRRKLFLDLVRCVIL
jgi:hypothetical protein